MAKKRKVTTTLLPSVQTTATVFVQLALPPEAEETLADAVPLQAEAISPFDEGDYSVAYEVLGRQRDQLNVLVVIASYEALNEAWHQWLLERGLLAQTRLDLSALGWVRAMVERRPALAKGEHLVLLRVPSEQLLLLIAEGHLVAMRALSPDAPVVDVVREGTVLLSQAAMSGVGGEIQSLVCFAKEATFGEPLEMLLEETPVFEALSDEDAETFLQQGLKLRADEGVTFDLTPQPWRDEAKAAKQKHMMMFGGAILGILWVLCAVMLYAKPKIEAHRVETLQREIRAQKEAYNEVLALEARVEMIQRYQDKRYSVLEMLRLFCAAKPQGITFQNFTYRQKPSRQPTAEGGTSSSQTQTLRVSGLAKSASDVYAFKDELLKDEHQRIGEVTINRLAQDAKTKDHRFDIEIAFPQEEEVEE